MNTGYSKAKTDWLPSAIVGSFALCTSATGFFMPVFFREKLGFSGSQIGLLFAFQAVTGILTAFPSGLSNDRITSRTLVASGLLIQGVGYALMGIVRLYIPFLMVFILWAVANNIFKLSLDVQVLKTDDGQYTGSRIGLYQGVRFFGLTLGTVGAGYLLTKFDFEWSLFFVAICCGILTILALWLVPTPILSSSLSNYRADFSNPKVLFFAIWMFLFSSHWGPEYTCYSLFLRDNLHLSLIQIGWYMSFEFLMFALTIFLIRHSMRTGDRVRSFAVLGLALSGIGHVGMVYPVFQISLAFRMLHGAGDGIIAMILYLGIARLFAIERLGGNAGLITLVTMFGFVTGALIASPLGESLGYGWPLFGSGIITLLLILPLIYRTKSKHSLI